MWGATYEHRLSNTIIENEGFVQGLWHKKRLFLLLREAFLKYYVVLRLVSVFYRAAVWLCL